MTLVAGVEQDEFRLFFGTGAPVRDDVGERSFSYEAASQPRSSFEPMVARSCVSRCDTASASEEGKTDMASDRL